MSTVPWKTSIVRFPSPRRRANTLTAAPVGLLAACISDNGRSVADPELTLDVTDAAGHVTNYRLLQDSIPALEITVPARSRAWDGSVDALRQQIVKAGGHVLIGLKPESASRTLETGVIPAISRSTFKTLSPSS